MKEWYGGEKAGKISLLNLRDGNDLNGGASKQELRGVITLNVHGIVEFSKHSYA